jgi:hypothetical protein
MMIKKEEEASQFRDKKYVSARSRKQMYAFVFIKA